MKNNTSVSKTVNISVARNTRMPCLWERGGYSVENKKGYAIIITGENGDAKKSIAGRSEENNRHALIPIEVGDLCLEAIKDDYNKVFEGKVCINIWKIKKININPKQMLPTGDCLLELINNYSFGIWIEEKQAEELKVPLKILEKKVETVNCVNPFYIK